MNLFHIHQPEQMADAGPGPPAFGRGIYKLAMHGLEE